MRHDKQRNEHKAQESDEGGKSLEPGAPADTGVRSFRIDDRDLELEHGVRRDDIAGTPFPVGQFGGDDELAVAPDLHGGNIEGLVAADPYVPSLNNLSPADHDLGGITWLCLVKGNRFGALVKGRKERIVASGIVGSLFVGSDVVTQYLVSREDIASRADLDVLVLESISRRDKRFQEGAGTRTGTRSLGLRLRTRGGKAMGGCRDDREECRENPEASGSFVVHIFETTAAIDDRIKNIDGVLYKINFVSDIKDVLRICSSLLERAFHKRQRHAANKDIQRTVVRKMPEIMKPRSLKYKTMNRAIETDDGCAYAQSVSMRWFHTCFGIFVGEIGMNPFKKWNNRIRSRMR